MAVIAHVGGLPLEEALPLVSVVGTGLLLARAWVVSHLRCSPRLRLRRRGPS